MRYPALILLTAYGLSAQGFRPDDPMEHELKPLKVTEASKRRLSDYYDAIRHTLATPGDLNRKRETPVRLKA